MPSQVFDVGDFRVFFRDLPAVLSQGDLQLVRAVGK